MVKPSASSGAITVSHKNMGVLGKGRMSAAARSVRGSASCGLPPDADHGVGVRSSKRVRLNEEKRAPPPPASPGTVEKKRAEEELDRLWSLPVQWDVPNIPHAPCKVATPPPQKKLYHNLSEEMLNDPGGALEELGLQIDEET